jgi:spore germination protein GerM
MKGRIKRGLVSRAGLVLWGLFTLALLFSVILLTLQLIELGSNPLSFAVTEPVPTAPITPASDDVTKTQPVALYFADPENGLLRVERRDMEIAASTVENCRRAVLELAKGSTSGLAPVMRPETQMHSLYRLEDGELVVDLSGEALDPARTSAGAEARLAYSLANTLTQRALQEDGPPVQQVRVLIDGLPYEGHIDLSAPYGPEPDWVSAGSEPDHG